MVTCTPSGNGKSMVEPRDRKKFRFNGRGRYLTSMFDNLTKDNIVLYAIKHYHNPSCEGINEFYDDMSDLSTSRDFFVNIKTLVYLKSYSPESYYNPE